MFNRSYINTHNKHPHYITDSQISILKKNIELSNIDKQLLVVIKNLSDPTKLKIYLLLQKVEELSVNDIAYILNISASTASHALSDLRYTGLIKAHRCGKLMCYSLHDSKKNNRFKGFIEKLALYLKSINESQTLSKRGGMFGE